MESQLLQDLEKSMPISDKLQNILYSVSKIASKMDISLFNPYDAYDKFKQSENFIQVIEPVYAKVLVMMDTECKKDVTFLLDTTPEGILEKAGEEFQDNKAREMVLPLIQFILSEYSNKKWN